MATAFADPEQLEAVLTGRISDAQWRAAVADVLVGRHGPGGAAAVAEWTSLHGRVDDAVLRIVRKERARRPVALLTNATDRLRADLDRLGLAGEVDAVFNSSELGLAKPDERVFALACASLELAPAQCLFVDDTPVNVRAAERLGMTGTTSSR